MSDSRGRRLKEGEVLPVVYGIRSYLEMLAVRDALAAIITDGDYHQDIDPKFYARAFQKINSKIGIIESAADPDRHDAPIGVRVDL